MCSIAGAVVMGASNPVFCVNGKGCKNKSSSTLVKSQHGAFDAVMRVPDLSLVAQIFVTSTPRTSSGHVFGGRIYLRGVRKYNFFSS